MANNYLQPVDNHYDLGNGDGLDDVDDDIFLYNSRTNSSASGGAGSATSNGITWRSTNPFEDQNQTFLERRRQIESRTLESTEKSLSLLYETEEVGNATARELAKQREQLEKSSRQLEEIHSTLRFSQRHLNGLKSVFGGLKNYLSGNRDVQSPRMNSSPSGSHISDEQPSASLSTNSSAYGYAVPVKSTQEERYDQQAAFRSGSGTSSYYQQENKQQRLPTNPFEAQIESNLENMCENLSRLKFLASDLGTEIETQNELLDNMNYKIEDVDIKMAKQNKEINKLLGKK